MYRHGWMEALADKVAVIAIGHIVNIYCKKTVVVSLLSLLCKKCRW